MDWNVGIGIGLQGRPQMFEGVARAREAAAQQYQAKKQQQQAKKLQDAEQAFMRQLQGKDYLPVDRKRIDNSVADAWEIIKSQADSEEPDMLSINQVVSKVVQDATNADKRKKNATTVLTRPGDYALSLDDAQILMTTEDPDALIEQLTLRGSGGLGYDKETGEFFVNPIKNYTGTQEFAASFVNKAKDAIFTETLPDEEFKINNTTFRGRAINPEIKNAFIQSRLSGENLEMVRREMNMSVWYGKPKPARGSQEEMDAMTQYVGGVYDQYVNPMRLRDRAGKGGGINVTVNTGAQADKPGSFTTSTENYNIYSDLSNRLGLPGFSFRSKGGLVVPNKRLQGAPIPTTMFDAETGERIASTGGEIVSSKIITAPVYTGRPKSFELQDRNGRPIPGPDGQPLKIELMPGKIIPTELLAPFAGTSLRDQFRYEKISWAQFREDDRSPVRNVYYQTTDTENRAVMDENGKEAERLAAIVNGLNDYISKNKNFTQQEIDEFTERFEAGGSVVNPTSGKNIGGVGGNLRFPSWEQWSKMPANKGKSKAQYFSEKAKQ